MGRRQGRTLIVLFAALARAAIAQNPPASTATPPAAQDTTRRDSTAQDTSGIARLLFTDFIAAGSGIAPRVQLTKGVVYRIEVQPGGTLDIRPALHPRQPPLFLVPLQSGTVLGAEGYLVVPPSTEDYLIDVASAEGSAGSTVRIYFDPKESARYTRIKAEGFRLPVVALGVSAVFIPAFRDARSSSQDALYGVSTKPRAAFGEKFCLDVLPNGRLLPDRTGGCGVAFTLWQRGAGGTFFTVGIEPEVVVARLPLQQLSITPQLAFGNTTGSKPYAVFVLYGLGLRYTAVFARAPRLGWQAQADLLDVSSKSDAPDPGRVNTLALSLQAGVLWKL